MANTPSRITDNLLNVFNYCFVETVPYAFFKPNPERDIAVNLVDKEYQSMSLKELQASLIQIFHNDRVHPDSLIHNGIGKKLF